MGLLWAFILVFNKSAWKWARNKPVFVENGSLNCRVNCHDFVAIWLLCATWAGILLMLTQLCTVTISHTYSLRIKETQPQNPYKKHLGDQDAISFKCWLIWNVQCIDIIISRIIQSFLYPIFTYLDISSYPEASLDSPRSVSYKSLRHQGQICSGRVEVSKEAERESCETAGGLSGTSWSLSYRVLGVWLGNSYSMLILFV